MSSMLLSLAGFWRLQESWRPTTWAPRWASWMRSTASTCTPGPPEWVAMAIGRPLNRVRNPSPWTESQAMALVSTGGREPLYSGAQITQRGAASSRRLSPSTSAGRPDAAWVRGL